MKPIEEWKPIPNSIYLISNTGLVKDALTGILKIQYDNGTGYKFVTIKIGNKFVNRYIHRLVAQAFIPNANNYSEIDHIDTCRDNNNSTNLRWCNRSQNCNNILTNIKMSEAKSGDRNPKVMLGRTGDKNPLSKKVLQFTLEGEFIKEWSGVREAARVLNINYGNLQQCCVGKRNSAGGFKWKLNE